LDSITINRVKTTGHSRLALLKLVNAAYNETHYKILTRLVNLDVTKWKTGRGTTEETSKW